MYVHWYSLLKTPLRLNLSRPRINQSLPIFVPLNLAGALDRVLTPGTS